jgi:hypothetical protein
VFKPFWNSTVDTLELTDVEKDKLKGAKQIPAAIMTRWSYVSRAIQHVLTYWDVWLQLSEDIPKATNTVEAVNKIASGLYANMHISLNRVYLEFLLPFLLKVHDPMMKWCESSDPRVGIVGFRARQAAFAYYQYMSALEKVRCDSWDPESQAFEAFRKLRATLSQEEKDIVDIAVTAFFKLARNKADEHFLRWTQTNLIWFAVFDDASNGQIVARILLDQAETAPTDLDIPLDQAETAPTDSDIALDQAETAPADLDTFVTFDAFLSMRVDQASLVELKDAIEFHRDVLVAIAAGADMWDEVSHTVGSVLGMFRQLYFDEFSAFPTTNQDTERGVKMKNYIVETGRQSKKSSSYAIAGNLSLGLPTSDNNTGEESDRGEDSGEDDDDSNREKKKRSSVGTQAAVEKFTKMEAQWTLVKPLLDKPVYAEAAISLKDNVNNKEVDFQLDRVQRKLLAFEAGRVSEKGLNAVQKQQTFDHTPLALGEIVWGDLRKKHHLEDVFKELQHRISTSLIKEIAISKVAVKDKVPMQDGIQRLREGKKWAELKVILQKAEGKLKTFKQCHPGEDLFKAL